MPATLGTFAEIVEAADRLTVDEQEMLVEIVQRRLLEYQREQLLRDVEEGRAAFARGELKPKTPAEMVREALS